MSRIVLILEESPILEDSLRHLNVEIVEDPTEISGTGAIIVNLTEQPLKISKLQIKNSLVLSQSFIEIPQEATCANLVLKSKRFSTIYVAGLVKKNSSTSRLVITDDNLLVGVRSSRNVYLLCVPYYVDLLIEPKRVIEELLNLYKMLIHENSVEKNVDIDEVVRQLSKIIIEERKKKGFSRTLQILNMCSQGICKDIDNMPTVVVDILERGGVLKDGHIDPERLHEILKRIEAYVYPR